MEKLSHHIEAETNLQPLGLIGDLDGSYRNMLAHLLNVRAINYGDIGKDAKIPIWTGGNMKVIFSGDILADRKCDGFQILLALSELRRQAQEAGGDITILAGNHEERMIGYLTGRYDHKRWDELLGSNGDHIGMTELEGFLDEKDKNLLGKERRLKIIQKMREDEKGKIILQEICMMQLVHIQGNGIHFHTQPSLGILDTIANEYKGNNNNLKGVIDAINRTWNDLLTRILLRGKENNTYKNIYTTFANIFLHTLNGTREHIKTRRQDPKRWPFNITPVDHPVYGYMRDMGITDIYHGHTSVIYDIGGIPTTNLNRRSRSIGGKQGIPKQTPSRILQFAGSIINTLSTK